MWLSCVPSRGSLFIARFCEMQFRPGPIFQTMQYSWESIYMLLERKLGPSCLSIAFYAKLVNPKAGRKVYLPKDWSDRQLAVNMITNVNSLLNHHQTSGTFSAQCTLQYHQCLYSWTISRLPCLQQTSTTICFLIWSHSAVAKKDYQYGNKFASPRCACRMKSFVLWNKEHLW